MRSMLLLAALAACARPGAPPATGDDASGGIARIAITGGPELVARGVVSSQYADVRLAASPDGRLLLWGSTDRPGPGGWNIWVSRLTEEGWSRPLAAPFNSEANDFDPAFAPDGKMVYFFSNRPGGVGGDDIYRVPVEGDGFGAVQHLGTEINSPGDEWAPSPSPDGTRLLFASNVPEAKHDLYVATLRGDGFDPPRLLPGAINTPDAEEFDATFLDDGESIVFSRATDIERGPTQLYFSGLGPSGYGPGRVLSEAVNTPGESALAPALDGADPRTLYFSSSRPGGPGKLDVYRVRYELKSPARP